MALPARVGRYEVEIVIGHGTIGRVLLARDPQFGRQVAIKVLRDDLALPAAVHAQLTDQFHRGARAAAALSHPAFVPLYDMGEDDGVGLYVVSELIKGLTLHDRMERGRLLRNEVAVLARTLGAALTVAHLAGVVHGDVKPENVMLSPTGPKIGDFGFPSALPASVEAPPAAEGTTVASRACVAPEVLAGGAPSARADQFALAAALYEAFTGRGPFAAPAGVGTSVGASSGAAKLRPLSTLLPEMRGATHLEAIFDCALAADPRRRFPSCEAFGSTLADALEAAHSTLPTPPASQSSIVPRATRRWQNAVAGLAVLVIFALVALGGQRRAASRGVSLRSAASAFAEAAAPHARIIPTGPRGDSVHPVSTVSPAPSFAPAAGASPTGGAGSSVSPNVRETSEAPTIAADAASRGTSETTSRIAPAKEIDRHP